MSKPAHETLARNPWRFTCPRGHHSIRPLASRDEYMCTRCKQLGNDYHYSPSLLVDKRRRARADDGEWCGP